MRQVVAEKFGGVDRHYAIAAGMQASTLQSYLEGRSVPGGEILIRLSQAGNVSIDWLLTGEEEPKKQIIIRSPEEVTVLTLLQKLQGVGNKELTIWLRQGLAFIEDVDEKRRAESLIVTLERQLQVEETHRKQKRGGGRSSSVS